MTPLELRIKEVSDAIRQIIREGQDFNQEGMANNLCTTYTDCKGCPLMSIKGLFDQTYCVPVESRFIRTHQTIITYDSLPSLTTHLLELKKGIQHEQR